MYNSFIKFLTVFAFAILLITACKVAQPYQQPGVATAGLYRGVETTDTNTIASPNMERNFYRRVAANTH